MFTNNIPTKQAYNQPTNILEILLAIPTFLCRFFVLYFFLAHWIKNASATTSNPTHLPTASTGNVHDIDLRFLSPGLAIGIDSPSDTLTGEYILCNLGDYDLDGTDDFGIGAPNYNASTGAVFIMSGKKLNATEHSLQHLRDSLLFTIHGTHPGDLLGSSLSCGFDIDQNGYKDILVGAPGYGQGVGFQQYCGIAYLLFGSANLTDIYLKSLSPAQGISYFYYVNSAISAGFSVLGGKDLNGDGKPDVVISAPNAYTFKGGSAGYIFILHTGTTFSNVNLYMFELSSSRTGILASGPSPYARAGRSVAFLNDLDNDGTCELIIGAPNIQKTYVLMSNNINNQVDLGNPSPSRVITLHGSSSIQDYFGNSVTSIENFDGHNSHGIMVSAHTCLVWTAGCPGAGTTYIFYINNNTSHLFADNATSTQMTRFFGPPASLTSFSINAVPDMNGDGQKEAVTCGVQFASEGLSYRGVCYVIFSQQDYISDLSLTDLLPSQGYAIYGAQASSFLGQSTAGIDIDKNGYSDLMIATADPYGSASIKLFIVFGNRYQSNSPTLLPSAHPSYFPSSVPTISPTGLPSYGPTSIPSASPTALPSYFPSICPSYVPSYVPSLIPTLVPSALPSWPPTFIPTLSPTVCPTVFPSYGPTVNPTYTPTTRSPTSVRIGSRSVTIELPNDSFDLRSMTYNEYADAIIITTKTSVFYARQSALGYIQGSSLTVTMETDRSNLFAITAGKHTYFTDQSSSTIFCIVEYDEMTQNYGSKCLTNYRPLISGTLVKGEYFAITESGPTSFFKTHLIRSESLTFLRTLQYIVTGATPTVSASCGDSFPSACLYQAGYNPNDMVILQVPDISQETFAGLGGFLSVIKRTEAEINLQYQPYRLSITHPEQF
ncbi:MAG: hypothetical protein LRY67_06330 [Gammaproteobacteria bacterium]|nr:hypothetical protein [Gammaproteobacteria bacterium]